MPILCDLQILQDSDENLINGTLLTSTTAEDANESYIPIGMISQSITATTRVLLVDPLYGVYVRWVK